MRVVQQLQVNAEHPKQQNPADTFPHFMPSESETPFGFTTSVKIEAECWRIISVLTIPEYLEAWLETPDGTGIEYNSESSTFARFRINRGDSGANHGVVNISRIQSRPDAITFIWETYRIGKTTTSIVEIMVRDGPRRCTLTLKHTGFRSMHEVEWFSNVWGRSLIKLRRLMEPLRARP